MELFPCATGLPPLEILHGVRSAGHRLQRELLVDFRSFQLVILRPVDASRTALHQKERLVLPKSPHDRMVKGTFDHGIFVAFPVVMHERIAVPGDHIEFFCQNTVIDVVEPLHEIGRDRNIFLLRAFPDGADLGSRIVREVPCGESPPVQLMTHNGDLAVGIRRFYFGKITVPGAPECGPPFVIKFLDIPIVALPKKVLKLRFT